MPTVTFKLPYCLFVINVTRYPTAEWVVQQLREAFPEAGPHRYVILDRDSKFDADAMAFVKATSLEPEPTSVRALWQNGIAGRWVGGWGREMLDRVIPMNQEHLLRLVRDYVSPFLEGRIHDSLGTDTPNAAVISNARLGGLHHRDS